MTCLRNILVGRFAAVYIYIDALLRKLKQTRTGKARRRGKRKRKRERMKMLEQFAVVRGTSDAVSSRPFLLHGKKEQRERMLLLHTVVAAGSVVVIKLYGRYIEVRTYIPSRDM